MYYVYMFLNIKFYKPGIKSNKLKQLTIIYNYHNYQSVLY